MAHDVFISYSSKDKLVADAVCASLEAAKIRCWITPRDILPGLDWAESIEDAITRSKLLVLIFSSYSNNSKQVSREISLAFNSEVTVIPFRIEDIEPKGAMKYYLSNTHWQDALTPPMENHIKKLVEIVSTFISKKIDDIKEVDKISSDQSKELKEQKLNEYKKSEHVPDKVLVSKEEKPEDLEIKKGFIKKQNKKKLAIILGVIGAVIIAAAITLLVKFPINKTEKLVETAIADVVEITSLLNESGQNAFSKIAFLSYQDVKGTNIYIMNSDGSNKELLTNNESIGDFCFSQDGTKIAFLSYHDGENPEIYIMNSDGSNKERLTNNEYKDVFPRFSPDGTKIAFLSDRDGGGTDMYIMNIDGSNPKRLTKNDSIVDSFIKNGSIVDLFCFSPDGTKIAFTSTRDGNSQIYIMNIDGSNQEGLTNNKYNEGLPCFSPDGLKIAFTSSRDGNLEIYIMNIDGSNQKNLTNDESKDIFSCFSPDGTKIVFTSYRDGENPEIYIMNSDGSNQKNLTNDESKDELPCFSPDGLKIAFTSSRDGNARIYIMNSDGSNQERLTNSEVFVDRWACFSPGS